MGNFPSGGKARLIFIGSAIAACFTYPAFWHSNGVVPPVMEGVDAF
jgi:hypothetical protein